MNNLSVDIFSLITNEIKCGKTFSGVLEQMKKKNGLPVAVLEGCDSFKTAFCASLKNEVSEPLLIIVHDEKQARILKETLCAFISNVYVYPAREFVFDPIESYSKEIEQERINIISRLKNGECDIVIAVPDAVMQYTVPEESFKSSRITLNIGDTKDMSVLISELVEMGYKSSYVLEGTGQFSVRGSIVDIFSPAYDKPCRFDFFDDSIDSMGFFDIVDQRRIENVDSYSIVPVSELFGVDYDAVISEINSMLTNSNENSRKVLEKELSSLMDEKKILGADKYFSLVYKKKETILDYLKESKIVIFESKKVFERIKAFEWTTNETIESMVQKGVAKFQNADVFIHSNEFSASIEKNSIILDSFESSEKPFEYKKVFFNNSVSIAFNRFETESMFESIKGWIDEKKKLLMVVRSEREANILKDSMFDCGINVIDACFCNLVECCNVGTSYVVCTTIIFSRCFFT